MEESCKNCKFSDGEPEELYYRRYPPQIVKGETSILGYTVRVGRYEWCGEFKERDNN